MASMIEKKRIRKISQARDCVRETQRLVLNGRDKLKKRAFPEDKILCSRSRQIDVLCDTLICHMSDSEHSVARGLSADEVRTILLALAHLFNFLPQWDCELRGIAEKLHSSCGAQSYERFKNI